MVFCEVLRLVRYVFGGTQMLLVALKAPLQMAQALV
jgi:hypothetical protein